MRIFLFVLSYVLVCCNLFATIAPENIKNSIWLKTPGNNSSRYELQKNETGYLISKAKALPLNIKQEFYANNGKLRVETTLEAKQDVWINFQQNYTLEGNKHQDCLFYMPGFWYRKNLRSPKEAPSFHTSDSWRVREDRLSVPLTGVFNQETGEYCTVLRIDEFKSDALSALSSGETILSSRTSIGYTGFDNLDGLPSLAFGYPSHEAPKSYIRKLTLDPETMMFECIKKGETRKITWELSVGKANDYSEFIQQVWHYSYDMLNPEKLDNSLNPEQAKSLLSNFFKESFVETSQLNYFSGVHMRTDDCQNTGIAEVGFVGRVLLNAFNALEYGEESKQPEFVVMANSIFSSYLKNGFTSNGFIREFVDYTNATETSIFSIRRQSEALYAILHFLRYERRKGNLYPEWEAKVKVLLGNFLKLQNTDGSFPRKFDNNMVLIDSTGGSTPSATLPLVMAYSYFKDKKYLNAAKLTGGYLEKELISNSDYFSSTLDANCEDKEASLYASTAMYYLALVSKGQERKHYTELTKKSAYFALSWYYLWDVPFASGQMLGDVGFKSRGWGNVSVENNHIDVFIFEFADVIDWLSSEFKEAQFAKMSEVIRSSMLQLMPVENNKFDIAKVGFYPEVVQHAKWDYGKNGKGFYNDIFAPGWTVASLWELLTPNRAEWFLNVNTKKQ